jgi:hypothetical protein
MTGLAILPDTLAPAELAALRFAAAARRKHASRLRRADFCRWAASRGASPRPAKSGGYLAALAEARRSASTITRRAAAIAHHHRAAGYDPPTASPALCGIRHTSGTAHRRPTVIAHMPGCRGCLLRRQFANCRL